MKRLEEILRGRQGRHKLLVAFVTAGYPDEQSFLELLPRLEDAGADAIEIGLPFSDPLADGPVIQQSSDRVLAQGMTTRRALELAAQLSEKMTIPLVAMGYLNPLLSYGMGRFLADAEHSGISGLILPDLPLEGDLGNEALIAASGLARIQLATPASGTARIARLARSSEGFIYLVSRLGVTGGRVAPNSELPHIIDILRANSSLPVLTGFGITDGAAAARTAALCDGVIVGSALLERLSAGPGSVDETAQFLATLRDAIDGRTEPALETRT